MSADYSQNGVIIKPKKPTSQNTSEDDSLSAKYTKMFRYMYSNKQTTFKSKKNYEELYYANVEDTQTQFTKKQLGFIQKKYDIPISTKIIYAIVEQIISFLSGTKPKTELMAPEETTRQWTLLYKRLIDDIWYENNVSSELMDALRDFAVTGSGYLRVRPNNFYKETTFGVSVEYVPWKHVYIDPSSRRALHDDADFACIATVIPRRKAERDYDIVLPTKGQIGNLSDPLTWYDETPEGFFDFYSTTGTQDKNDVVWEKEFFEVELVKHYITPEGYTSLQKPKAITVPNDEKMMLGQQIQSAEMQLSQQLQQTQEAVGQAQEQQMNYSGAGQTGALEEENALQSNAQNYQMATQIEQMKMAMMEMPDMVTKYQLTLDNGDVVIVTEYSIVKQKRVKSTLMIDTKIIRQQYEPCDTIPIIPLHFSIEKNPYKSYGVTHYISDVQKAENKLWALLIYDMQLRASLRVLMPENAVNDPQQFERKFAIPGAALTYNADPMLPNGGKPEIVDIGTANQAIIQILQMLRSSAEYITGIFGVVQGNPDSAPGTFGATQSLQTFGTQRIKSASRNIENSLSLLGYIMVSYLQRYCPKEKITELLGEGYDPSLINQTTNLKFKVRTQISQTLPTSRQIAANALSTLAGQLGDPQLQQVLTQYALKFLDIQEADEISETLNVVQQLQQQVSQLGNQLKDSESKMQSLQNNIFQKDMAVAKAKGQAQIDIAVNNAKNEAGAEPEIGNTDIGDW